LILVKNWQVFTSQQIRKDFQNLLAGEAIIIFLQEQLKPFHHIFSDWTLTQQNKPDQAKRKRFFLCTNGIVLLY
jgi:hypothetical protein